MRSSHRLLLGALAALVLAGALAGVSSANQLGFSNQGWRVVFPVAGEPPPGLVSCPFTLEGSFHSRTLSKVSEALIGYVTRAAIAEGFCRGGRARFLTEGLPWHMRYESFTGTLPFITTVSGHIVGWGILFEFAEIPGSSCLYVTSVTEPARFILSRSVETGIITSFRLDEHTTIRLASGNSMLCPARAFVFGTTPNFTLLGTTTSITVTLVV